jgi:hypothetical protein
MNCNHPNGYYVDDADEVFRCVDCTRIISPEEWDNEHSHSICDLAWSTDYVDGEYQHECDLDKGHEGAHKCHCGEEG